MKQPKKLTRDQKEQLTRKGYDPSKFRFVEEDSTCWLFLNPETEERIWIEKR